MDVSDDDCERGGDEGFVEAEQETRCSSLRCCCCWCWSLVLVVLASLVAAAVVGLPTSKPPPEQMEAETWPVVDDDGYVQAYKVKGRWINWWSRNRYGGFAFVTNIWRDKDDSNIPSDKGAIAEHLPVKTPYWLRPETQEAGAKQVGAPGSRVTWIGHATVLAEVDSAVILTDPIFSQRASMFQWMGPKRYTQPACTVKTLPKKLDAVVISHNHYDHLDYNSVKDLHARYRDGLHWFVPKDMGSWFTGNFGIDSQNVHELVWWEEAKIPGTDVKLILTPSNHWGRRGAFDENKALWGSWAAVGPRSRFWFGGDTAYTDDGFKQIGERLGPFNISAIPIGAYEPRWFMKFVHVNPAEAVKIHQDIRSQKSVGIHWGTFKLTYEHYLAPKFETREEMMKQGLPAADFQVVNLGETVEGMSRDDIMAPKYL